MRQAAMRVVVGAAAGLGAAAPAWACGAMVGPDGTVIAADAQRAAFDLRTAGEVTVHYEVRVQGDASRFGWLLPVVGQVVEVTDGAPSFFDALEQRTAPRFDLLANNSPAPQGCACGPGSKALSGDGNAFGGDTGLTVIEQGYAGPFAYAVLEATAQGALEAWLVENGFSAGVAADAFAAYTADPRGVQWVAVRLAPSGAMSSDLVLPPLTVRYGPAADGQLAVEYPARLAGTSTLPAVHTTLYVLGAGVGTVGAPWSSPAVTDSTQVLEGRSSTDSPDAVWERHLTEVGAGGLQVFQTWSGQYEDGTAWLTRFDAIHAPGTLTADLPLADDGGQRWVDTLITIPAPDTGGAGLLLLPLGLGAVAWGRRRRR